MTTVLAAGPARAQNSLTSPGVPPAPTPAQVERNVPALANPINSPITGSSEQPLVVGTPPPPSLEALQDARPGQQSKKGLAPGRMDMLRTAALTYGAQGGLAARSFAINQMLRRYQAQLDSTFDFGALVLPVNAGQTLMRPPIVSAAQMAFALGDNGQVARETSCIYEITREAQLASTPPNWRSYLVRTWADPARPTDAALPRTRQEVAYWNKWVGSLDTRALTDAKVKEFGACFQAVLADELRRLGVKVGYDANKQAVVIERVPEYAKTAFSKRDRQILHKAKAFADSQGLTWDDLSAEKKLDIMEEASAEGRLGKMKADEKRIWRDQAQALGWQHSSVLQEVEYEALSDDARFDRAYRFAAARLVEEFETAAVIDHDKLGMYAARGLIGVGIAGGPRDIRRVVELLEERGIRMKGEHVALIVGMTDSKVRVTNTTQVRIEEKLASLARASTRDNSAALSTKAIKAAVARSGYTFTHEQRAAIHALAEGGAMTMLTGVAGAGKTTLLEPLVAAWKADRRFGANGREVIGAAMAWRQADALQDAGIERTFALSNLLAQVESGEVQPTRNTVLVLDEASQIGPRSLLKLLELQTRSGMTIKMLGDREQAQAIEAGDSIEILRRVLPPEALPELLTTMRQTTRRGREVAGLFRDGEAGQALNMKRADGHAMMVGGDRDQVVEGIADLYIARRDILMTSGAKRGVTVSAPTNDDVADISRAIRERLTDRSMNLTRGHGKADGFPARFFGGCQTTSGAGSPNGQSR